MGVRRAMLATSSRCWTRKPEGSAAVSLGHDRRTERILKSVCSAIDSTFGTTRATDAGQLGCFAFRSYHVFSLFIAMPLDCRIRQAFPNMQGLFSEMAMSALLLFW